MASDRYPEKTKDFADALADCNGLRGAGFVRWAFTPGMLFAAPEKWWGDRGLRPRPHEGVDLCLYLDESGRIFALDASARIPVMLDGTVRKIEKDYLGQSVYVDHAVDDGDGRSLWTMYGHTAPLDHVRPGTSVRQGEIIASLPEKNKKATGPRPHLHLTIAWVYPERALRELGWETLHDRGIALLIDPLQAMGCPYRILDPGVSPESL
jgi:murein DD-endopeptidase MepM/ murein hydrolase activator NlpD